VIPAGGIGAVSIVAASNTGVFGLDGSLSVGLVAALSTGSVDDEPHVVSLLAGDGTSCASRASGAETASAGGAAGSGEASNKKPMPNNTPTVAVMTALRETR